MKRRALVCAFLLTFVVSAANGATIVIDQGGGGDYPEIQPGLNLADHGDTVLVMPGVYSGIDNTNLDFGGKALVLRSHSGPGVTIIDGGGADRAFLFDDGETSATVVQGFSLSDCHGQWGGAIYCYGSSPTIRSCVFTANHCTEHGGAIYLGTSGASVIDCEFTGNSPGNSRQGGAIFCLTAADVSIEACIFDANSANIGSAVSWIGSSTGTMTDCHMTNNTGGCAVYCDNSSPVFLQCTFSGNTGQYAGAAYLYESTSTFLECDFFDNTTESRYTGAGGIYCDIADPVLQNCTFSDNSVGDGGGTIYCRDASPQLDNCIIAFDAAGPAFAEYAGLTNEPVLSCCDLYGNAGGNWVGPAAGQGSVNNNMEVDPEFCDRAVGDLRLFDTSPCAAGNNPACGQVGALWVACDSPVRRVSWGSIKALYR